MLLFCFFSSCILLQLPIYQTKPSIPYSSMKEHPYIGELDRFTAYVRTNLPYARTQRFARNVPYTTVPPRRAHGTLQAAGMKVSYGLLHFRRSAFSSPHTAGVRLCESFLCGESTSSTGDVSRDSKGAQHPWHTTLVQSLVCYTLPEVYRSQTQKSPMPDTLTVWTRDLMLL